MSSSGNKDSRIILKYPEAYKPETVIRKQSNFSAKTREASVSGELGKNGMNICKTIVLGDVSVGKTSLVSRYCRNVFETDYKATIGIDFQSELYNVFGHPFSMQIWDTAGQERFQFIVSAYYRGAHVILVVFDLTDIKTLEGARKWLEEALAENVQHSPDVFLVGTKKDLCNPDDLEEMEKRAITFAQEVKAEYWSVSSKTGENVDWLFSRTTALAFDQAIIREWDEIKGIGVSKKQKIGGAAIKLDNQASKEPIKRKSRC